MPEINILDKQVADLIAAGEVVERPASVVKELMENAIDAGASSITAEIRRGGNTYIRITDNGCGIDRNNIRKAFISHATSKISAADDLDSILTLGFRGEALASVAAVARVEVMTRAENENIGTRYCIEGSEETVLDDAGCPKGTTVIVRDLFFNTPARMKFLKKDITEANAVAAVVDRIALSHPEVSVKFIREGKEVLSTNGDGVMKNAIYSVLGKDFTSGLIPCSNDLNGVQVSGFVSKPLAARPNRTMQFFFLNGRLIKTRTGTAALEQAYKNAIMVGKFPSCVLNINISAQAVDVNVHPSKTEVRFADEKRIFDGIYYGVKCALESGDTRPQMSFESKAQMKLGSQKMPQPFKAEQMKISEKPKETFNPFKAEPTKQEINSGIKNPFFIKEDLRKKEPVFDVRVTVNSPEKEKPETIESDEDILLNNPSPKISEIKEEKIHSAEENVKVEIVNNPETELNASAKKEEVIKKEETVIVSEKDLPEPFKIIGEAFKTYILAEQGDKILIIDKHAAHERMIFESLKKNADSAESQILLMPVTISLSKEEYNAVLENADLFLKAGYALDDFGQGMIIVSEAPVYLEAGDIEGVIQELAALLSDNKKSMIPEKLDWIYHSTACRAAIKAGDITSAYELEKFTESLLNNPDIRYCPHGRPVIMEMTKREIEKNFGRI